SGTRYALDFMKVRAGIDALINPGASAGINSARCPGIDDDGEHIRIHDQSLLDVLPGFATIDGFPGQMPGAGVNHLRIYRIDGDRFHFMQFRASHGTDQLPGSAAVLASIDAGECPGNKYFRVRRRLCESPDGLTFHVADGIPVMTFIFTDKNSAVRPIQSPGSDQNAPGVRLIKKYIVNNQRIVGGDFAQPCPVLGIFSFIHPAVRSSKKDVRGACRAGSETSGVSAIRADRMPLLRKCTGSEKTY